MVVLAFRRRRARVHGARSAQRLPAPPWPAMSWRRHLCPRGSSRHPRGRRTCESAASQRKRCEYSWRPQVPSAQAAATGLTARAQKNVTHPWAGAGLRPGKCRCRWIRSVQSISHRATCARLRTWRPQPASPRTRTCAEDVRASGECAFASRMCLICLERAFRMRRFWTSCQTWRRRTSAPVSSLRTIVQIIPCWPDDRLGRRPPFAKNRPPTVRDTPIWLA